MLRDTWGVPHIYAKNQKDLFFGQGFVQAQDRLWQMEVWRLQAEGRLSEIGGPSFLKRDKLARQVRFRGDWDAEWASYGPGAKEIVSAFVEGVNAFIDQCGDNLPIEFLLTGAKPTPWTPEVCAGRMAGFIMSRNASTEVLRALIVKDVGVEEADRLVPTSPKRPLPAVDLTAVDDDLLELFSSLTAPIRLPLDALDTGGFDEEATGINAESGGSNNWALAGRLTATGMPILANDPHRPITVPSLRYIVHLVCPPDETGQGWNVIGASEPAVPGVSTGHNTQVAWGITIVNTDQQDIYIEETDPDDPLLYRVGDEWQRMEVESHQFRVRGESSPREVDLKFTRHGPVIQEPSAAHRAIAIRWAGSEPGAAGYLGSLMVDRANDWPQFLDAASGWKMPSANLVYADLKGHIGWIAAALTPVRNGWDGILPVSGAAPENEWTGWVPTGELPQKFDPDEGYIATANQNTLSPDYERTITYDWSPAFRFQRIDEVLRDSKGAEQNVNSSVQLQQDATSIPARRLIALLRETKIEEPAQNWPAELLLDWDCVLRRDSTAAALFKVWEDQLVQTVIQPRVPQRLWSVYSTRPLTHMLPLMLDLLENPGSDFGADPLRGRDALLLEALGSAVSRLNKELGEDRSTWTWAKLHQAHFRHMLSPGGVELTKSQRELAAAFNLPSVARDGDEQTPLSTGPGFDQTIGASFSHVSDLANWDRSVAINAPGQSGQPGSKHYGDLLDLWANAEYFPLLFSRQAVESAVDESLILEPHAESAAN